MLNQNLHFWQRSLALRGWSWFKKTDPCFEFKTFAMGEFLKQRVSNERYQGIGYWNKKSMKMNQNSTKLWKFSTRKMWIQVKLVIFVIHLHNFGSFQILKIRSRVKSKFSRHNFTSTKNRSIAFHLPKYDWKHSVRPSLWLDDEAFLRLQIETLQRKNQLNI